MAMIFYGTSAAEGIPSPFCTCDVCENARKVGGKEIRTRTMFRIDEAHCIDLGADAYCQAIRYGDFTKLCHVLVTHTHEDHLAFMMFNIRKMARTRNREPLCGSHFGNMGENSANYIVVLPDGRKPGGAFRCV